jgi:hypothetical protein
MKNKNLLNLLTLSFLLPAAAFAQVSTNHAYAVTGETKGNFSWNSIREIDLANGAVVRNIYIPSLNKVDVLDAATQDKIAPAVAGPNATDNYLQTLIAATAYDAKNNRLYFTHMQDARLSYMDLNSASPKIYTVENQFLKSFNVLPGEDDNITRMAFGADGNGYALTNNGNHLIRFTTGAKIIITDLGSLKDAAANVDNSVHKTHDNWGGDMVGDAFGNLYLITAKANIFKINPNTLTATFAGTIKNLPKDYTVNAAAVDADGNVVVSSAIDITNYYRFNLNTLNATGISKSENDVFNASDFANSNLAFQKEANELKATNPTSNPIKPTVGVFPNPVQNKMLNITFSGFKKGNQTIELSSLNGKNILNKTVDATAKIQAINLPYSTVPGVYLIKVINEGNVVFTNKIVVE